MSFDFLSRLVKERERCSVAFVGAAAGEVLEAAEMVAKEGIAEPILVGDRAQTKRIAADRDIDLFGMEIVDASDDREAASVASDMVAQGTAQALMKGRTPTWILMKEGLRGGLRRDDRLLSHVTLVEVPSFERPILVTDSALTPYPSFAQRIQIIENAVEVMRVLGVRAPKVALLSASEEVNEKIPFSIEAGEIARMNLPGEPLESCGVIAGPLDLGCAIHPETARIKGVEGPVAGDADILVTPDIVAANVLSKSLIYLAGGAVAACVVGGAVPIGMVSRASPARDKYNALLLTLAIR